MTKAAVLSLIHKCSHILIAAYQLQLVSNTHLAESRSVCHFGSSSAQVTDINF